MTFAPPQFVVAKTWIIAVGNGNFAWSNPLSSFSPGQQAAFAETGRTAGHRLVLASATFPVRVSQGGRRFAARFVSVLTARGRRDDF